MTKINTLAVVDEAYRVLCKLFDPDTISRADLSENRVVKSIADLKLLRRALEKNNVRQLETTTGDPVEKEMTVHEYNQLIVREIKLRHPEFDTIEITYLDPDHIDKSSRQWKLRINEEHEAWVEYKTYDHPENFVLVFASATLDEFTFELPLVDRRFCTRY